MVRVRDRARFRVRRAASTADSTAAAAAVTTAASVQHGTVQSLLRSPPLEQAQVGLLGLG